MTEPRKPVPDEDLLEFLGGIDELNEDSTDGDFPDFLANGGMDKAEVGKDVERPRSPATKAPEKEGKRD
jgi:hypothetical protein